MYLIFVLWEWSQLFILLFRLFVKNFKFYLNCLSLAENSCFPGSSLVVLENGSRKRMSDVQVGDLVLTVNKNNALSFSPIILNRHRSPKEVGTFLVLQTNTGHSLTLSPQHLVYIKWKNTKHNGTEQNADITSFRPVFASAVKKEHSVLVYDLSLIHI